MAVSLIQEKRTANFVLSLSNDTTKNVSIGTLALSESAWDADKAMAIMSALAPCLDGSFSKATTIPTYRMEED